MEHRSQWTVTKVCSLLLYCVLLMIGCNEKSQPLPKTFVVEGRLLDAEDAPVKDGMIVFQSPENAEHSSHAEIQPDGKFRLFTLIDGERIDGVRPGEYRATYLPRMSEAQTELPIELDQSFIVKESENVFEIKLKE